MNRPKHLIKFAQSARLAKLLVALCLPLACFGVANLPQSAAAETGDEPEYRQYMAKYRRPPEIPYPKDNLFTKDRELLGRTLFFDPRLSGSNWISCATCHNPAFSWGDGLAKGIGNGMQQLGRRTPTILNLAWAEPLFWDGRAQTLEDQALGPVVSRGEMNLSLDKMIEKVKAISGYHDLFQKAYSNEGITEQTVAKAIATFERTIVSGKAPFDEWIEGKESAISEEAKQGFLLFNTKANCAKCHSDWRFTDDGFHDIGLPGDDIGRGKLFSEIEVNQFAFKAPTLRNVDHRAPFMHDGSEATLDDVIEYYNKGGKVRRPSLSPEMKALNLTAEEKKGLVVFLRTLTSVDRPIEIPVMPR